MNTQEITELLKASNANDFWSGVGYFTGRVIFTIEHKGDSKVGAVKQLARIGVTV